MGSWGLGSREGRMVAVAGRRGAWSSRGWEKAEVGKQWLKGMNF